MASAATAEMRARRGDALRGRLDDRRGLSTGKAGLFLGECGFYFLSGENKRDEYGFAFSAVIAAGIGGKAGESVAAIDKLFYIQEQELILRHGNRQERQRCKCAIWSDRTATLLYGTIRTRLEPGRAVRDSARSRLCIR